MSNAAQASLIALATHARSFPCRPLLVGFPFKLAPVPHEAAAYAHLLRESFVAA